MGRTLFIFDLGSPTLVVGQFSHGVGGSYLFVSSNYLGIFYLGWVNPQVGQFHLRNGCRGGCSWVCFWGWACQMDMKNIIFDLEFAEERKNPNPLHSYPLLSNLGPGHDIYNRPRSRVHSWPARERGMWETLRATEVARVLRLDLKYIRGLSKGNFRGLRSGIASSCEEFIFDLCWASHLCSLAIVRMPHKRRASCDDQPEEKGISSFLSHHFSSP
jgi:hypothetical protein